MTAAATPPVGGGALNDTCVVHPDGGGSARSYWKGCRCPECAAAVATYHRDRARRYARPDVIDLGNLTNIGSVRAHVEALREKGVGLSTIARTARVDIRTLHRLVRGDVKRIRLDTEERILAVWPSDLAPGSLVPFDQVAPLIEDIVGSGMSRGALAREVYGPATKANDIGRGDRTRLRKETADRIRAIHAREVPATTVEDESLGDDPIEGLRMLMVQRNSMAWRDQGRCRTLDLGDPRKHPFFPKRGQSVRHGRDACKGCPVIEPCLAFALESNEVGTWGGTTEADRREIRRLQAADGLSMADAVREAVA